MKVSQLLYAMQVDLSSPYHDCFYAAFDQGLDSDGNAKQFDYRQSATVDGRKPREAVDAVAYLARMQRGGLTQPHGVMITVEPHPSRLHIVCYSNNAAELFGLPDKVSRSVVGGRHRGEPARSRLRVCSVKVIRCGGAGDGVPGSRCSPAVR